MRLFHAASRIAGRAFLAGTLACSVLSTAGGAIVLHEHGALRAHLHLLAESDLRTNNAWSSQFGHSPIGASYVGSQRVRLLALVATGSVFVVPRSDGGIDPAGLVSSRCATASTEPQVRPIPTFAAAVCPPWRGRSACATVLLRNHTLLI